MGIIGDAELNEQQIKLPKHQIFFSSQTLTDSQRGLLVMLCGIRNKLSFQDNKVFVYDRVRLTFTDSRGS